MKESDELTEKIIGAAIAVHRIVGPALMLNFGESRLIDSIQRHLSDATCPTQPVRRNLSDATMQTKQTHDLTRRCIGSLGEMVSLLLTVLGRISRFYIDISRQFTDSRKRPSMTVFLGLSSCRRNFHGVTVVIVFLWSAVIHRRFPFLPFRL